MDQPLAPGVGSAPSSLEAGRLGAADGAALGVESDEAARKIICETQFQRHLAAAAAQIEQKEAAWVTLRAWCVAANITKYGNMFRGWLAESRGIFKPVSLGEHHLADGDGIARATAHMPEFGLPVSLDARRADGQRWHLWGNNCACSLDARSVALGCGTRG